MNKPIILFDSECLLCNFLVRFLIKRDNNCFYYGSLNSTKYQHYNSIVVLLPKNLKPDSKNTQNQNIIIKSIAVFHIIHTMSYPWKCLLIFKIIPRPLLDLLYGGIAKIRGLTNCVKPTACLLDLSKSQTINNKIITITLKP